MIGPSQSVAALNPEERRRLLRTMLEARSELGRRLPLSFAQERMWLLDQLNPGNPAYNMAAAVRLRGPLDVRSLERGLNEIVRRHGSLRTTFLAEAGRPHQRAARELTLRLPVVELGEAGPGGWEGEVQRLAAEEAKRPFDLAAGPLIRVRLLRLGEGEHVVLLTVHHIVSDGWSMTLLVRELAAVYEAFRLGRPSPLPELPVQYADFARWQREHLKGETLERHLGYWRRQLAGLTAMEVPADRPRPAIQTFRGAACRSDIDARLWGRVRSLGEGEGATPFMALLAVLQILLGRYCGQEDIAVGTPIAGRNRAEIEGLIGCFVNTLVMRTDLSGDPTVRELISRVRGVALDAYGHQDLPFEKLLEELRPDRDLSRTPFFQVFLNMVNVGTPRLTVGGLVLEPMSAVEPHSKFDITMYAREIDGGLRLRLVYNAELFEVARMELLLRQFEHLLCQIVEVPDARINELSLVTAACRALLPEPAAVLGEPQHEPVTRIMASVVAGAPRHPAVERGGRAWSYQELWARAEEVARALRARGLGESEVVAVTGPKGFGLIVAMVGVELAGGALMPLDPNLPDERQRTMLDEASARLLIDVRGEGFRGSGCGTHGGLATLLVDADEGRIVGSGVGGADIALPEVSADAAAYVFFTSGSTGRPKGICGTHKGLSHFLAWQRREFGIGPGDRVAQLTSLSFDVVLRDIFLPLTSGGTLCLPDREELAGSGEVIEWLERERITVLHGVPTLLRHWLSRAGAGRRGGHIRWLFSAGEPLTDAVVLRWREVFPEGRVVNLYGPTETTLAKCFHVIPGDPAPGIQPVGRPLPETQALVLRPDGQLCGLGEPGEIVLRTPFRTRGYLGGDDVGGRGFIPNPLGRDPSDLVYKTGDRGRYRPDGVLEILGRMDDQVKVRGVRVEPSEVAAALARHPGVLAGAVIAHRDESGQHYLAAYVVRRGGGTEAPETGNGAGDGGAAGRLRAEAGRELTAELLRAHLTSRLPSAMVPSAFVFLDALPLLPNGKVDRLALPVPPAAGPSGGAPFVAPRTPLESEIAAIWMEVLGIERVGADDDFFSLGGHSLLAAQVVSRVRDRLRAQLPLRDLFRATTVAKLAQCVEAARRGERAPGRPRIKRAPRDTELPLSLNQEALWFLDRLEPDRPTYTNYPAVRIRGPLDLEALRRAFNEMVRRHETLRTTFPERDGRPVQVIAPEARVEVPVVDLTAVPAADRDARLWALMAEEMAGRIDLQRGPLIRARAVRLGPDDHVVMGATHHIIHDGWSLAVMARELSALYGAFHGGDVPSLPELPVQYADFSVWQREMLQGETLERLRAYWARHLEGVPALELPTDFPRPPVRSTRGDSRDCRLSLELSAGVNAFARREGVTPFMTLLAAFHVLLGRYTGQEDFAVGTPVANRTEPETEPLIGYFINMLVLRADLSGDPSFRDVVGRVRRVALDGFEHQDLTLDQVVDAVRPARDLSRHPLFQTMFVLQNVPRRATHDFGLEVAPLRERPAARSSDFELSLVLRETAEGFRGRVVFNTDLFSPETIEGMIRQYAMILSDVLARPDGPLSGLPLASDGGREELLARRGAPIDDPRGRACAHELFQGQVERAPGAIAVIDGGREWTYRELNGRANQFAHALRECGLGTGRVVGVRLPRSADMVAAMLGVLKSGAAYLPLDPGFPPERLRYALEDARADALITWRGLPGKLPEGLPRVICVGEDAGWLAGQPTGNLGAGIGGDGLAYIIYTSGSTGRPKGVMIEHGALTHYVLGAIGEYGIGASDRILQFASISYDAHVEEIYPCLAQGGTLVLRPEGALDSFEAFLRTCDEAGLTILSIPTGFWHDLTDAIESQGLAFPAALKTVIIGGEEARPESLANWFEAVGQGVRLLNTYGPTEATVVATATELRSADASGGRVPIGRPLAGVSVYVLDRHGRLTPPGAPGELFIGGGGVARGYVGREDLTDECFPRDRFSRTAGGRMYKTGDIVRWRPDGRLEFIGRTDRQLKIRGFRIEPGEVEQALCEHGLISGAAVVALERAPGDVQLVAYVTTRGGGAVPNSELRRFLGERLPGHMIPSFFVALAALPSTTSGKVDRRALPEPDWTRSASHGEYVAPRTEVERNLARIWEETLRIDRVGARDNFFGLGGNSLLAVRLAHRIRQIFSVDVTLVALFKAATLADLAAQIADLQEAGGARACESRPMPRRAWTGPAPLSSSQEHFWKVARLFPGRPISHLHATVPISGPLDAETVCETVNEVVRRHETLRTSFSVGAEGRPVQVVSPVLRLDVPVEDISHLSPAEREDKIRELSRSEKGRPFDLEGIPLLRVRLVRVGHEEHLLLLTTHHILLDGWSLQLLVREVAEIYDAISAGRARPLPGSGPQYRDYAAWERDYLAGPDRERLFGFWRRRLQGVTNPAIPTDRPRVPGRNHLQERCPFQISESLRAGVVRLANAERVTPFGAFLAAFKVLLAIRCQSDDIAVAVPVGNRQRPETHRMMGVFTNTVVMRSDMSGDPTFRELLGRLRETIDLDLDHQELPLEMLADELQPGRDRTRFPLVQVMFNYLQRVSAQRLRRRTDLQIGRYRPDVEPTSTRLDLVMALVEGARGMRGTLHYDMALFDRGTIEHLARHYVHLLGAIVAEPDRRLSQLAGVGVPAAGDAGGFGDEASAGGGLADAVRFFATSRVSGRADGCRSLVTLKEGGAGIPVFCFPGLGGNAAVFVPLARALCGDSPLYGLQAQGFEGAEVPQERIEDMADLYVEEIRSVARSGPCCALIGWSLGGLVALEVARRLAAKGGGGPRLLALLDTRLGLRAGLGDATVVRRVAALLGVPGMGLKGMFGGISRRSIVGLASKRLGMDAGDIERLVAICSAQLRAVARYRPVPYGGRVAYFRPGEGRRGMDSAWVRLCPDLREVLVPGDHYSMLKEPHVANLAERLEAEFGAGGEPKGEG